MYTLLRNLHLALGLFSAVFLLAYALSAAQMAYPLYRPQSTETVTVIHVPRELDPSPRALAQWLMDRHDHRGDVTDITTTPLGLSLTIVRPGTTHRVVFDSRDRAAHVTTSTTNAIGMLNRIHHVGGVRHEYWAANAWGWFLLAVSVCLLALAISGVVMWFQRHRERRMGLVVLVAGLAWGLGLLILIRTA